MRPYLVWSYDYYPDSAGQKTMHRLCHELNGAGQEAYVAYQKRNPDWNTPYRKGPLSGLWIAVYPEIVRGNPWAAPYVARWVLNNPGKLGGDKTYHPSEMVFAFHEAFNDMGVPAERILYLPTVELEIYAEQHLARQGAVFYVGKGRQTREFPGAIEITDDLKRDQRLLAETLNRAALLYSFDPLTAMIRIALLCGCPVVVIPDETVTQKQIDLIVGPGVGWGAVPEPFDSALIRSEELAAYDTFHERLTDFIRITQTA